MDPFIAYLLIKNLERNHDKTKFKKVNIKAEEKYKINNKINNCVRCGQYPVWCRCVLK